MQKKKTPIESIQDIQSVVRSLERDVTNVNDLYIRLDIVMLREWKIWFEQAERWYSEIKNELG